MDPDELAFTSALEQAAMLERGDVTSAELVECYLTRIESLNPRLNSYITVAADHARAAAKDADARRALGGEHSRFLGVPISIKDLADTAGIVSTHGTAEWRDRVPEHDDVVIAKIRAAGFVILGKTVVPEFGPLNISEPPGYPPGRNPWNPDLNCGGSSGGAAAALVSGMCPISHGSDGGGSIRNPSSWCGVFGLKPQRGRISRAPNPPSMFSHDGPITRTVADAAALLDVMEGYVTGDAWWAPPPARPFLDEVGVDPGTLRVAFHPHPGIPRDECAPANRKAAEDAAQLLGRPRPRGERGRALGIRRRGRDECGGDLRRGTRRVRGPRPVSTARHARPVDEDARGDGQAGSRGRVRQGDAWPRRDGTPYGRILRRLRPVRLAHARAAATRRWGACRARESKT